MFRIRLRIHFCYRVILYALFALALLPMLLNAQSASRARAITPALPSAPGAVSGARQYYLSRMLVQANKVRSACASGYHFASIWELADPSALKYDTSRGLSSSDSGGGPPTTINYMGNPLTARGWVRTSFSYSVSAISGHANCGNWLNNYGLYWGTTANLPSNWIGNEQDIGVWDVGVGTCDTSLWVWCVQDDSVWRVFIALMSHNF